MCPRLKPEMHELQSGYFRHAVAFYELHIGAPDSLRIGDVDVCSEYVQLVAEAGPEQEAEMDREPTMGPEPSMGPEPTMGPDVGASVPPQMFYTGGAPDWWTEGQRLYQTHYDAQQTQFAAILAGQQAQQTQYAAILAQQQAQQTQYASILAQQQTQQTQLDAIQTQQRSMYEEQQRHWEVDQRHRDSDLEWRRTIDDYFKKLSLGSGGGGDEGNEVPK